MRAKSLITLFMVTTTLLFLESCSRESPLKENVGLKNNHSRVFASRTPFEDPKAFLDSIANTPVDSANSIPDTMTVTVDDSVYLIGVLPRFVEKIGLFQWTMIQGKDTTEIQGDNDKQFAWAYSKPGVYYPLFIAFDGNNATDTAGTGTKRTYIRVIDTKPELSVPQDTLWTKHEGDITFPIFALDSFGTIKNVMLDLDASGKEKPKSWKFEQEKDSLYLTVNYNEKYVDSLGNQKIYVIVEDDDGNEAKDSVNLHYNRLPTLKIISPLDGSRHSNKERFYFYYESEDMDNPQDLRFFIYAQVSKNGKSPTKAFTSSDLIAKEITSNIFEPTTEDGRNVITLVDNPEVEITGRIFWDMYVTDGYDIVRMERIATSDSTSRPWNFYIGDLSSTQGTFYGVAKYEGRDNHAGIRIEFNNGSKIFDGFTDEKGNYTIRADYGSYEVRASSDKIREYEYAFQYDLFIESGATIKVDDLILKDETAPEVNVTKVDTFTVRSMTLNIVARDNASLMNSVTAKFDGKDKELSCSSDENDIYCKMILENLTDGKYTWETTAKDNAGNVTTIKDTFYVAATTLELDVNGTKKQYIGESGKLTFSATVGNALPAAESISWAAELNGKKIEETTKLDENGKGSLELTYDEINAFTDENKDYVMTVTYAENGVNMSSQVKFGKLSNKPSIYFTEPASETNVTKNDPVVFKASAFLGKSSNKITVSWNCGTNLSAGSTCPADKDYTANTSDIEVTLKFATLGDHKVILNVLSDDGLTDSDTVVVKVISDKPSITATVKGNEYKINSTVDVKVSASDKFGTINEIRWGCTDGNNLTMVKNDNSKAVPTPAQSISDFPITLTLTNIESNNYRCLITAVDDDQEEGSDTLTFKVLKDPPIVTLKTHADTVKINSQQKINATAYDALGSITKYEIACGSNLKNLPSWIEMSKNDTTVTMPSDAGNYYCVVRVTDDDDNTAQDTATYKVLVGRPTVTGSVNYKTVTIKDVVELNAHAVDSLGSIVKYEWGCGSKSTSNITFTYSSTTTPKTNMTMPSKADDHYQCIVRVTDDDGNEAKDTVEIKVLLAPPTVKVENKSMTIRAGFNIALNATANDNNGVPSDPGEIVKREWSCALPDRISSNWKTVSVYDTVWKAPAANANFICVARATDNDGNTATDTTTFKYTDETPKIWVTSELIYLNEGDEFLLDAKVNSAWQGINWFSWECVDQATGKSMEKNVPEYDYDANGGTFAVGKDSSYSEKGKNMYCIVSAEEKSTREVLKDTTEVRIMKYYPKGVISAADTVFLWSGDNAVPTESKFFYDVKTWGGFCSQPGELAAKNKSLYGYSWNFSSVDDYFYEGPTDGTLDTNILEFYTALKRPSEEGSMTIGLAYLDSTVEAPEVPTHSFRLRHSADTVYRTVYFKKAWQNLSQDTVVETALSNVPVAFTLIGDKPATAYLSGKSTVSVSVYNGNTWNKLDQFSATDSVTAVQLASDGKDLYVGALTTKNDFIVKKSSGGTSALNTGSTIAGVSAPKLTFSDEGKPIIAFMNTEESNKGYLAYLNGSSWTKVNVFNTALREISVKATSDGRVILVGVSNTTQYTGYVAMLNSNYSSALASTKISDNIGTISLAVDGTSLYMSFMNRDTDMYGASFRKGSIKTNSITWENPIQIFEAYISYHMSIAARNGVVYIASGDNLRANLSQVHVFRYEANKWHYHGENQLPYFGKSFYDNNGYYLRGFAPELTLDNSGKLYLSMLARASGSAANTKYNGPIIMKYAADNWNVTPATCEE